MENNPGATWVRWPYARIRREISTDRGKVTRFVIQLEYDETASYGGTEQSVWQTVARFDHAPGGPHGHDITDEGLHLDLYRDGERYERSWSFPPIPLAKAPRWCEKWLEENCDQLVERYEQWHEITDGRTSP